MKKITYTLAFFERALVLQIVEKKATVEGNFEHDGFTITSSRAIYSAQLRAAGMTTRMVAHTAETPTFLMFGSNGERDLYAEKLKAAIKMWSDAP